MYTPQTFISGVTDGRSTILPSFPPDKPSRFSLDTAGVIGLLGGDDALSAITAVHVYENRRWLGWHNNPGSFQIFQRLSSFAKSTSLSNVSESPSKTVHKNPITLFGVDGYKGPKFRAAHSGTVIEETGHLAALLVKACAAWDSVGKVIQGRKSQSVGITIVDLGQTPPTETRPAHSRVSTLLFAGIPIAVSFAACALCASVEDWYASSLILLGIVASGIFSLVLGSADFVFTHPEPAKGSPPGDGILGSDKDIVLVRGTEGAVNSITRGRFTLRFSNQCHHSLIRLCSFLFFLQAIAQLLLISQASLFGQVMFLTSLGVSALYNARISSWDKGKINQKLLFERVLEDLTLTKYTLGTRTSAVVFILLILQPQDPTALLDELLPNDTKVWKQWKKTVLERLHYPNDKTLQFESRAGELDGFTQPEKDLLQLLYADARVAYNGYRDHLQVDSL